MSNEDVSRFYGSLQLLKKLNSYYSEDPMNDPVCRNLLYGESSETDSSQNESLEQQPDSLKEKIVKEGLDSVMPPID